MKSTSTSYSPDVQIHLRVDNNYIRLSDVLLNSATLYEPAELLPDTVGSLVFSINGEVEEYAVVIEQGASVSSARFTFDYLAESQFTPD